MQSSPLRVNLGGEGEVPGVINQQGPWVLDPGWRSSKEGKTLQELVAEGHQFVIADNKRLPFASDSVDEVITNSVPIDVDTWLGPGVQSSEILRILKPGGRWTHDGVVRFIKP
jgi:hypothetical protein